ncbi:C4-dicarboxylate ABC transporter [Streptomyces sp. HNM0575]|uniref:SLC13 family permease n=1 Tax=Streptomyces sp. HNM0575 TaxID=2716338 RepID=UPI00145E5BD8|nr:SLC13 family permease [Streptomyces sp. HNM0575]NLU74313.1 C4-dicarboxylate ABC transporter [Streptomyces sp. HNM0575]
MSIHVIGVATLAIVFIVGTLRPVNIGALALVATFLIGTLAVHESLDKILSGFPPDLFVLLVGVTYLFGLASANGTIEWLIDRAVRLLGDRPLLVPWLIFVFSAVPTTAGALGPAGVAMLAPLCLRLGARYGIDRRMSALMVMHGSCLGNFSPLNGLTIIVRKAAEANGLRLSGGELFFGNAAYNIGLAVIIYLCFGGRPLWRTHRKGAVTVAAADGGSAVSAPVPEGAALAGAGAGTSAGAGAGMGAGADAGTHAAGRSADVTAATGDIAGATTPDASPPPPAGTAPGTATAPATATPTAATAPPSAATPPHAPAPSATALRADQVITLVAVVGVAVGALVFDVEIGFLALVAAVLLHVVFPGRFEQADKRIVWSVVLLICGVVTLVEALQRYGTVEVIGKGIADLGAPLLTALLLCLVAAVTSAFASSAGLLGVLIPLAVPFLVQGEIGVTAVITALAISATVVDSTPFSSVGALTLANAPEHERPQLFRVMLVWGLAMAVTAPPLTWLLFTLPSAH